MPSLERAETDTEGLLLVLILVAVGFILYEVRGIFSCQNATQTGVFYKLFCNVGTSQSGGQSPNTGISGSGDCNSDICTGVSDNVDTSDAYDYES